MEITKIQIGNALFMLEGLNAPSPEADAVVCGALGRPVSAVTSSIDAAMAIAVEVLPDPTIDIETAWRRVAGSKPFGRAIICGMRHAAVVGPNPAMALIAAALKAAQQEG